MVKFVVDTNVIWSTLYRANSEIGQFVLSTDPELVSFIAPEFLKVEIDNHFPRIVDASGQSEDEIRVVLELAYEKIHFIADHLIPFEYYASCLKYVRDTDLNDLVFVALTEYLQCRLWTGDRKLIDGLTGKGYSNVIDFRRVKSIVLGPK